MKTKQILVAGLLLLAGVATVNAQSVQSSTETGFGLENGAYQNVTTSGVFIGYQAGKFNTAGNNTYVGHGAGSVNANTGNGNNCFFGAAAGTKNTTGESNVFIGSSAGYSNTTGSYNIYLGTQAGVNSLGNTNVFIGHGAGVTNVSGGGNTYLGFGAGQNATGGGNVFLGSTAGKFETGNNKLYISNSETTTPLIYGDFSAAKLGVGGINTFPTTVGGANVSTYKLFVKGGILTEEVRVATGWADYVFADNYNLPSLSDVEKYIAVNGHLPNVPSAKVVEADGIAVGNMAKIHQEKIEELTLYAIQQDKQLEAQKLQLEKQQQEIDELKAAIKALVNKQ